MLYGSYLPDCHFQSVLCTCLSNLLLATCSARVIPSGLLGHLRPALPHLSLTSVRVSSFNLFYNFVTSQIHSTAKPSGLRLDYSWTSIHLSVLSHQCLNSSR